MFRWFRFLGVFCALALLTALQSEPKTRADDKDTPKEGKASGLVTNRRDSWIEVKSDGEEEPVRYTFGDDAKLLKSLKGIFVVNRVQLTYKQDGEKRQLVSITKVGIRGSGTMTGTVVRSYEWWVALKPRTGPIEGFAAKFPFDDHKDVMAKLKGLEKGGRVRR